MIPHKYKQFLSLKFSNPCVCVCLYKIKNKRYRQQEDKGGMEVIDQPEGRA